MAMRVVAGVLYARDKVLIARKKKGKSNEGLWEFPGGKVEENESESEALKRELFEELGIQTEIGRYIGSYIFDSGADRIELIFFLAEWLSGDFRLKDHDAVEWINLKEIKKFPLAPADIPVLDELEKLLC